MNFKILTIICIAAICSVANAAPVENTKKEAVVKAKPILKIHKEVLKNGLEIVIVPLNSNGVVNFGIIYRVGSADDPMCKIGQSHFLEHMMFKGTKSISAPILNYLQSKYYSYRNAFTTFDNTCYEWVCNKEFTDLALKVEADRMVNLIIDDEGFIPEQKVVLEERNSHDANPMWRHLWDAIYKILYLHSNYSFPTIGYPHQIKAYTKKSLQKHYKKFYVPNNATILIVGDVDIEETVAKIKKIFGGLKKGPEIERNRVIDPEDLNMKYTMDRASKQITSRILNLFYTVDRSNLDTVRKYYTAEITLDCLFGAGSIMRKKFVDQENKVHSIGSWIDFKAFDKAFIAIWTELQDKTKMTDLEDDIMTNLREKPITKVMFETVKKRMLGSLDLMLDNPSSVFSAVLEGMFASYKIEDMENVKEIIKSITFEDVKKFESDILNEKNMTHRIYGHPEGTA